MPAQLVLIFAYHFPPENVIGAARPFRFYKYLCRAGYCCEVITAAAQGPAADPAVIHVPDRFEAAPRQGLSHQLEWGVRRFLLPGSAGTAWSQKAYPVAREILRRHAGRRAAVFSTFPPQGTHLAAWRLARAEAVPWIADFRDPLGGIQSDEFSRVQKKLFCWLERRIILAADAVIANTDAMQRRWQEQFPGRAKSIHLIWNGFDPEARLLPKALPERPYQELTHIGELYGGRTVVPILESVSRLRESGRIPAGLRIRLIGPAEPAALGSPELLERARAAGWLELSQGAIPRAEAWGIMRTSDRLLLIQPQSDLQVPGKLFEYLQIGRPILAFIKPDSPIERVLAGSGVPYRCIYPGSRAPAIDDTIAEFLALPATAVAANQWFEENFNAEAQARTLGAIIERLRPGTTSIS